MNYGSFSNYYTWKVYAQYVGNQDWFNSWKGSASEELAKWRNAKSPDPRADAILSLAAAIKDECMASRSAGDLEGEIVYHVYTEVVNWEEIATRFLWLVEVKEEK
jgi:hypothetical protein